MRESVVESIEQDLPAGNRCINTPLNLQRINRNLLATGVGEDRDVCDRNRIGARIQNSDLHLPASRHRTTCEGCHGSALKRTESQPEHHAAVSLCFQDSLSFGTCHETFRPVNEWLTRKARCDEEAGITTGPSLEAPTPKPTALGNVPIDRIGHRTKYARHSYAVELLENGRECSDSDGWRPFVTGHQA